MRKLNRISMTALVAVSCVGAASAQDGVIRARMGVSQNNFTSIYSGGPMKSDYQSLNTGLTFIQSSGWYADVALKNSMSAKWSLNGFGNDSDNGLQIGSGNDPYVRKDLTLTFGKALEGGLQVFGGYQQANSTIDMGPLFPTAANYKEKFNVKGYFAGIGKTIALPVGSMNINVALGKMKGRLLAGDQNWYESDSGTGVSLGATYSYPLTEKTTLSIEYKTQSYKYKFSSGPSTGGDDKIQVFGANISYQF